MQYSSGISGNSSDEQRSELGIWNCCLAVWEMYRCKLLLLLRNVSQTRPSRTTVSWDVSFTQLVYATCLFHSGNTGYSLSITLSLPLIFHIYLVWLVHLMCVFLCVYSHLIPILMTFCPWPSYLGWLAVSGDMVLWKHINLFVMSQIFSLVQRYRREQKVCWCSCSAAV